MKFIQNKKLILLLIFLGIFIFSSLTLATEEARLLAEWPQLPGGIRLTPESNLTDLIAYFYEWGIALGGLVAFIALIIAGLHYMTSVGDPAKMKEAMNRIKSAFLGLALLLGSWLILHTINPELTEFRPLRFRPGKIAGLLLCVKDGDCPRNYTCSPFIFDTLPEDDPDGEKDKGICIPVPGKAGIEGCAFIRIYERVRWEGYIRTMPMGDIARDVAGLKSVRGFRQLTPEEKARIDKGELVVVDDKDKLDGRIVRGDFIESRGCVLALFDVPGCRARRFMGKTFTPNHNIHRGADVKCVELFAK